MIKKIRLRFILLALTALLVLLAVIVAGMNLMNYSAVVSEADDVLSVLPKHKGGLPEDREGLDDFRMSPEIPFESRFFVVQLDKYGNVISTETDKIVSVDRSQAIAYALEIYGGTSRSGFADNFRYAVRSDELGTRITFLDCGRRLDAFYRFLYSSILMSVAGYAIICIIVIILSGRIVRPIAESYEKQKQFITDAGHEIKTPLTIINANVDVLEMDLGAENECLTDIQTQIKRLSSLTNELIYLSRMEEQRDSLEKIEFPVSDLVYDTVFAFRSPAQLDRKELALRIEPMLTMNGDTKAIEKLVSILMNNALKYSPADSKISVCLQRSSRQRLTLSVENTSNYPISEERLSHVFERFYRADASRSSETGGHGIGLAVAQAIVQAHNGSIRAEKADRNVFRIAVTF